MSERQALPMDVRLMNLTASVLAVVAIGVVIYGSLAWLVRLPLFNFTRITVQGELMHNNEVTLRANVLPQLAGNFFTMNLQRVRQSFETVPWVRAAVVQREFPNRLRVSLSEHHPVAVWGDDAGGSVMVNRYGQLFEAQADDADIEHLPRFDGPRDQVMRVLEMYQLLQPVVQGMDMEIDRLQLSGRGTWSLATNHGAQIELGKGGPREVMDRLDMFWKTLSQVTARYGRTPGSLQSADLRYENGYALRLKGVTTLEPGQLPGRKP
ncbi:MAG: Cell division protein FtsQ [Pseudomonadota bacterium]|jgi:cell division protein FtsQ